MLSRIRNPVVKIVFYAFLLLWSVSVLYPLVWTVLDALKNNEQFFLNAPWSLPRLPLLWDNFGYVWNKYHFDRYFVNSLIITTGSTLLGLILSATTAYVLARHPFRGSGALYLLYVSSMMIPFVLALIPLFFLMNSFGLINNPLGMILVYASSVLAFGIFVLVGFFKSLPKELEESAVIDGASYFGTFFRIMLPLSQPGLITIVIVNVLNIWNEYIIGTILLNDPRQYTLPVEIAVMRAEMEYRVEWGPLFAGLLFTIVPVLIVYIVFQRKIASGITAGAVK